MSEIDISKIVVVSCGAPADGYMIIYDLGRNFHVLSDKSGRMLHFKNKKTADDYLSEAKLNSRFFIRDQKKPISQPVNEPDEIGRIMDAILSALWKLTVEDLGVFISGDGDTFFDVFDKVRNDVIQNLRTTSNK